MNKDKEQKGISQPLIRQGSLYRTSSNTNPNVPKQRRTRPVTINERTTTLIPYQTGGSKYNSYTVDQLKEKIKKKSIAQEYLAESKVARPRKALLIQALIIADAKKKPQSSGSRRKAL